MTRLRALIADDEPLARTMVASLLRRDPEIETVVECSDAGSVREVLATQHVDMAFLDIEMPDATGLDLAQELHGPVVVFVTAFSRYAPDAFDVDAIDYVLKPFSDDRLKEALRRAKRRVRERRMAELASQIAILSADLVDDGQACRQSGVTHLDRLTFKQGDRTIVLKTSDIIWIEAEDYYVRVHARQGRHLLRATLASLEEQLDPKTFLRVHRAALVNVDEIRELHSENGLVLVLSNDAQVAVSRSRRSTVEANLRPHYRRLNLPSNVRRS